MESGKADPIAVCRCRRQADSGSVGSYRKLARRQVALQHQASQRFSTTKIPETADKNGVWEWTWAPDDPVKLHVYSYPLKGFAPCDLEIAGGAPPRTITLKPEHRITGRVTDAVTGKPIPPFTVIPIDVFRKDWLNAERMNAKVGKDGRLDYLADSHRHSRCGCGSRPTDIARKPGRSSASATTRRAPRISACSRASPIVGVVLDAAGQPAEKAEVLMATPTEEVRLREHDDVRKTTNR